MSNSKKLIGAIESYVGGFAPFVLYPGEKEQEALALGAYRVLTGAEQTILL